MIPHRPNEPAGSSPAPAATNIYNYTLLSSAVDILVVCGVQCEVTMDPLDNLSRLIIGAVLEDAVDQLAIVSATFGPR